MTEKRYFRLEGTQTVVDTCGIISDDEDGYVDTTLLSFDEVINRLNEQHEEIDKLKKERDFLQSELFDTTHKVRKRLLNEVKKEIEKLERYE